MKIANEELKVHNNSTMNLQRKVSAHDIYERITKNLPENAIIYSNLTHEILNSEEISRRRDNLTYLNPDNNY